MRVFIMICMIIPFFSSYAGGLAAPETVAPDATPEARSRALFEEMGKVLTHPRCVNCHPKDDQPRRGEDSRLHEPPVWRGADGHGVVAMRCDSCHQNRNIDYAELPGHPEWHLAPAEMAWQDKSLSEICHQLKDPATNGGMSMEALSRHMAEDSLVGWGWRPGAGREPAPGTQAELGRLFEAWVASGAVCPD